MRYLLFRCLDETAGLSPDDDSDAGGSAAGTASRSSNSSPPASIRGSRHSS